MTDVLKIGVIGLSRAFTLMVSAFDGDPRVQLVAAADPRPEAREAFAAEFGGRTYADANDLCADYLRRKIRATVKDTVVAEKLIPK